MNIIDETPAFFAPGTIVSHFKRFERTWEDPMQYLYEIVGIALHSETREELMVYRALYGNGGLFCRPKEMFFSPVDRNKYPHAVQNQRFAFYCASRQEL